jgi:heme-degrading monooxygenase HmoA
MIQILGRVRIQDLPAFISVFSTRGARARAEHGSRSATLFKVCEAADEVVVLFDWESREAFQAFLSDPNVKETMKASGAMAPPEFTCLEKVASFPT